MTYQCYRNVCLGMLAIGLCLPMILGLLYPNLHVSPFYWNFLQMCGLIGSIVFSSLGRRKSSAQPAGV